MAPATYNFPTAYTGDTFNEVVLSFTHGDLPVSLVGATIEWDFKTADVAIPDFTPPYTIVDNTIVVTEHVVLILAAHYKYCLRITFPDGHIQTYLHGVWVITDCCHA